MFDRVVFAGGGHRCWWQAGWWDVAALRAGLKPIQIAAVSAGAATACLLFANDAPTALAHYHAVLGPQARNAYWHRWRAGRGAVFPHEGIYRDALHRLLGGPHFERLQQSAPEIRIAMARGPAGLSPAIAVALGLVVYNIEKHVLKPLHPSFGSRIGFRSEVATVQSCATDQELVDLIIASSCTPPFTAIQVRDNRPTLDGGLFDNVPIRALDPAQFPAKKGAAWLSRPGTEVADPLLWQGDSAATPAPTTLVLVTRRYEGRALVFREGPRVYVQPSRKVNASSWDYTAPASYLETYQQGRDDAAHFLRWLDEQRSGRPECVTQQ